MNAPINLNSQSAQVALNEGAVQFAPEVAGKPKDGIKLETERKINHENFVAKLLESGNSAEVTQGILGDFMAKAATAGLILEPKVGKTSANDSERTKEGQNLQSEKGTKADASAATSRYIMEIAKKGRQNKDQQGQQQQSGRDYTQAIKDTLIMGFLGMANSKIEEVMHKRGAYSLFRELYAQPGMDKETADAVISEARSKANEELRSFLPEELENQLVKATLLQDNKFDEVVKLIKVSKSADFNAEQWINEVWPSKKENHGLYLMDVPPSAVGVNVNVNTDQNDARKERSKYEYIDEDKQDVVINRLRSVYMQMALGNSLMDRVSTFFKVRKLKNGMIKLGIYSDELNEKLVREGKAMAKLKAMEMLDEGLHEEATFFEASTAKDLVDKKLKNTLANLERLGVSLTDEEFVAIKTKSQRKILEIAQKELELVRAGVKDQVLAQREGMLAKLVAKLESELGEVSHASVQVAA
jgi:hypothetical protein